MVSTCATGPVRVLLIEEAPDLIDTMTVFLADEGYAVDVACDGEHGLLKAIAADYDAIVISETLPECDGWSVLRELRRKRECVSVLMLTDSAPFQNQLEDFDSDPVDYLIRPFSPSELLSRIELLAQRTSRTVEARIELGSISVDLKSQTVAVEGRVVSLTAREYALFELLANRRGRLVPRTEIYDHMSDHFDDSLTNLVDVYISRIRRKIGFNVITTRRGSGYIIYDALSSGES